MVWAVRAVLYTMIGRGHTGGDGADTPDTLLIGKQQPEQPEQPEAAVSSDVPSDLGQGDLSGCSWPMALNRPNSPTSAAGIFRRSCAAPLPRSRPPRRRSRRGRSLNGFAISSSPEDRREPEPGQIFTRIRIRTIKTASTTEPAIVYDDTVETY